MLEWIGLLPAFPLAGFLALVLTRGKLPRRIAGVIGVGSVGLSFALAAAITVEFLGSDALSHTQVLWTWMSVGNFTPGFSFYLDGLTVVMLLIISGVGFLIHLYSTGFMADDPGFARFFSYMNLFVASMLVLVLADNLVLLYLGWEGVGLCSYLLIGFWYDNPANGYAARKAFVVTRVGDTSMAIGLFLLFQQLGTLNIQEILTLAPQQWSEGSGMVVAASALLLGGAVGKSAQLPLQTWLPDAMAGPTPISALIHAATMVTAGVYLIARTHVLFELAPSVQILVAFVGLATLLMAGFTALTQRDIKRILAYSTVSQIGYMFLALGVGAWSAAIFHLMTHAFFKALLFLAAGTVILSLHHEHDIFRMGGMRKKLPVAFWSFVIGSAALTALPFTSGFYSKDAILLAALEQPQYGTLLWLGGVLGAFLTAIYSFRLVFVAFFGDDHTQDAHAHHSDDHGHDDHHHGPVKEITGFVMAAPLVILGILSLVGGFITVPVDSVFGVHEEHHASTLVHGFMIAVPIFGVLISYLLYSGAPQGRGLQQWLKSMRESAFGSGLTRFWFSGWGMDALYNLLFVKPFVALAQLNRKDLIDQFYGLLVELARISNRAIVLTQTGYLRWYAISLIGGLVLVIGIGVWA
ncbi:MAG: NADH-quinone oxidoreductase subunit L [Gammaproteobacteria bacterium]|nr:NADH-quinone oxidoreductase subunit L [Gammaproteobacteria bacterium]MDP2346176.1 NADH-quinone oxidoreductase subunit L [Gammaproteobacteria bacterium]